MIVMKFGGSSLESPEALTRVARIIADWGPEERFVVVSAMGKTTDRLLEAGRVAASGDSRAAERLVAGLQRYHEEQALDVMSGEARECWRGIVAETFQELASLLRGLAVLHELTPRSIDAVSSYGERLSSAAMALILDSAGIKATHIDARRAMITDARHTQAAPDYAATEVALTKAWQDKKEGSVAVMGGFIGATVDGATTTLGRGGSDFSAAIAGASLHAREIQIWTDVDGLLTADPRVFPTPVRLKKLSFAEAAELAYFGAKVLHPATVVPAVERNIPVRILNSRRPLVEGTVLTAGGAKSTNPIKSISSKRDITVVSVQSSRMLMAYGFLARIFEVFARHETAVDMVATTEVSVSVTIDQTSRLDAIIQDLAGFSDVHVERHQGIVCLVGENLRYTPGIVGRAFERLQDINIRMISQGASLMNISFVVADADVPQVVARLHDAFFATLDAEVFGA